MTHFFDDFFFIIDNALTHVEFGIEYQVKKEKFKENCDKKELGMTTG